MTTAKKAAPKKAAVAKKAEPDKVRLPINPVKPGDVKQRALMHNQWAVFVPSDYVQSQIEDSKLWTFMAPKFKDLDFVTVTSEDGSWFCEARIRRTVQMEVHVQVYDWITLTAPMIAKEIEIGEHYVIRHFGTLRKFAVCNKTNGTIVKEGFNTQVEAMKYVTEHIQSTQAVA